MAGQATGSLVGRSATELAAAVRGGRVTPLEVVEAHLGRIAVADRRVHAFQVVRAGEAREEARALGARPDLAALPLAGVPVAVKDNLDVAGCPTRFGSLASSDAPAPADDELVRRLREAGAVPVGKTTVPELGLWPFTESAAFGITRNPWNLNHTPSGSSGGAAAAVAAAMVPLALGSDGGGSLRMPASCCGLVGIKPGPGRVPAPRDRTTWLALAEFGPLATTVADLALMLDVLAGRTSGAGAPEVAPPDRPLRIAASARPPATGVRVHPHVLERFQVTVEVLRGAGHDVTVTRPPYRNGDAIPFLRRAFVGAAEDAPRFRFEALEPRTRSWVRTGRRLRRAWPATPRTGAAARVRFERWFAATGFDLLLTPTLATPPLRVGAYQGKGLWRTVLGLTGFMPYTPMMNVIGFPAMSVPAGQSPDGLPIGVQLAAPRGAEPLLLSVACQLELLQPWPRHAPRDHWGA